MSTVPVSFVVVIDQLEVPVDYQVLPRFPFQSLLLIFCVVILGEDLLGGQKQFSHTLQMIF